MVDKMGASSSCDATTTAKTQHPAGPRRYRGRRRWLGGLGPRFQTTKQEMSHEKKAPRLVVLYTMSPQNHEK